MIEIKKGIPIPRKIPVSDLHDTIAQMLPGDCIEVPGRDCNSYNGRSAVGWAAKKNGWKFTVRGMVDKGLVRVWRIK